VEADRNLYAAVEFGRSREQHELARAVRKLLKVNKNSIADLAEALGIRKENLWSKLAGVKLAMEPDVILWAGPGLGFHT
jgi:transcriptional regulator with PAS, ATPase and Fis domain